MRFSYTSFMHFKIHMLQYKIVDIYANSVYYYMQYIKTARQRFNMLKEVVYMSYRNYVPEGVQDYLPQECYNKKQVEDLMRRRFLRCGYHEIETPMFEYYDVFSDGIGSVRQEKMIKFFDNLGRILTLRPDITMPISRVVSTRMRNAKLPLRLCYVGQAFGYDTTGYIEQKEFTQAGIELMGESSVSADAEVIYMAIQSLLDSRAWKTSRLSSARWSFLKV